MRGKRLKLYGKGKLTMMTKEKPIIFSTLLIPAIQNLKPNVWPPEPIDPGKPWKWQTRRIVKDDIVNSFDIDIDGKVIAYIDQATGDSYKQSLGLGV